MINTAPNTKKTQMILRITKKITKSCRSSPTGKRNVGQRISLLDFMNLYLTTYKVKYTFFYAFVY